MTKSSYERTPLHIARQRKAHHERRLTEWRAKYAEDLARREALIAELAAEIARLEAAPEGTRWEKR
jgi:hypothetical protein